MKKFLLIVTALLTIFSCHMPDNFGFYQPITMDMEVPEGSPEFKAGWYDGCRSGLGIGYFLNSAAYRSESGPNFSPVYMHDPQYQAGWGTAYWACAGHEIYFTMHHQDYTKGPLE